MSVPVDPRAETLLRIVEMEGAETMQTDDVVERLHRLRVHLWLADVIPRCKDMTRIEADPDARLILHERQDHGQLFEGATKRCALTGGRLQQHGHVELPELVEESIQRAGDTANPLVDT